MCRIMKSYRKCDKRWITENVLKDEKLLKIDEMEKLLQLFQFDQKS